MYTTHAVFKYTLTLTLTLTRPPSRAVGTRRPIDRAIDDPRGDRPAHENRDVRAVSEGHNRIFGRCSELRGGAPVPWVFGGEVLGGESATLFEPRKLNELGHPPPAVALSGGEPALLEEAEEPALERFSLLSGATRRTSFWRHSCERLASLCTASRNASGTPAEGQREGWAPRQRLPRKPPAGVL